MHACMYVCMYVFMYVCTHVCMSVFVCACVYIRVIGGAEAGSVSKPKKIQTGNSKHLQTQQVQTRSIKALPGISKVLECTGKWFDMHTCTTCMKEAHRAHLPKAPFPFSRQTGFLWKTNDLGFQEVHARRPDSSKS